jgi:hypothetical protein
MVDLQGEQAQQISELVRAVADLERRMSALEAKVGAAQSESSPQTEVPVPAGEVAALPAITSPDNLAPLFGWAFLGIAGAYLLRALTESHAIPGLLGAAAGLAYAAWWLYLAARRAWDRPLFSTVHSLTAALILAPLLWEVTIRFHLLTLEVASAALVLFSIWGLVMGWRHNITAIAWIATLAALFTTSALFRETHDAAAWVITTLLIAVAIEFSACRDHWLGLRWVVAAVADLTILALTFVVERPGSAPLLVFGAQMALLVIYLTSTVDRTIFRGLHISWFEIIQAAVAFAIAIGGALHVATAAGTGLVTVGMVCLIGGAACYLVSFAFLERRADRVRNFYTYSTYAILLITAACFLLLTGWPRASAFSALAVAMMAVGLFGERTTLRVHAALYLLLAASSSQLVQHAAASIIRTGEPAPIGSGYLAALAGALLCYGAVLRFGTRKPAHWTDPAEAVISAALSSWGVAGLAAAGFSAVISESAPLRTALITALAIAAGWCGRRNERRELVWLVYPLLAVAGLKLVFEDLRQGRSITLFLSLIFFGGALVLLPRMWRARAVASD